MKKSLLLWQVFGLTFSAVLGTLLHFIFDWAELGILKSISATNESTFEHMKILFFPMLIFAIIQSFYFKEYCNFWCVKLIGTVIGVFLIPIIFYTLIGVFGTTPAIINILIFFVSAGIGYLIEGLLFKNAKPNCKNSIIPISILILLAISFVIFSYYPLNIPIFIDPRL